MKNRWISLAAVFAVLAAIAIVLSPIAFAQHKVEKLPARVGELEKAYATLKGQSADLKAEHAKLAGVVDEMQKRVGDSGWKALDATTKMSSLQWQTYSFVLALLVAVGFGGWQGYKLLRDKLEADMKESMRDHEGLLRHSTGALAFGQLSLGFWNQYSAVPAGPGADEEKKRLLDAALLLSTYALDHAEKLERFQDEKYEELVTNVRANHAYWLAEQADPKDRRSPNPKNADSALRLAKEAFAVASAYMKAPGTKYINRWPDWVESYCYVLTRFGSEDEKQAAKQLVLAVCDDVRVDAGWKMQIRKEWTRTEPAGPSAEPRAQ